MGILGADDGLRRFRQGLTQNTEEAGATISTTQSIFLDDAPRDVVQELLRQPRPVRGHEVHRLHRAQLLDLDRIGALPSRIDCLDFKLR